MRLNMLAGITNTDQYEASIWPGGEVQFKLREQLNVNESEVEIYIRLTSANHIMFLALAIEVVRRQVPDIKVIVWIHYMPYQQSDREFSMNECWGLKAASSILNSLKVDKWLITDAHSDATPAFLKNAALFDQSSHTKSALKYLRMIHKEKDWTIKNNLTVLTTDAGSYKKIYALCEKIEFDEGIIESANKFRGSDGRLKLRVSTTDFLGRDILMIDDIGLGCRTFTELANEISNRNVGNLYLSLTHGVFNAGFSELAKYFKKIFTTNSWQSRAQVMELLKKENFGDMDFIQVHPLFNE